MCPIDFGDMVNQENREKAGGVSIPRSSRGETPSEIFTREEARRALTELSVPVTSRVYFSVAQLYSHLHGDGGSCISRCLCESLITRGAHIHIIVK